MFLNKFAMKKTYENPEAESIQVTIEMGLLTTSGSTDPIIWGKAPRDYRDDPTTTGN